MVKPLSQTPAPTGRPSNAAARGLASANDDDWDAEPETDFETQNVIDLAIEKAIDGVSAALNEPTRVASSVASSGRCTPVALS